MTLVDTVTGELIEPLSRDDAERLSTRIRLRLDTLADNYTAVMPLIREAIDRQAHTALGYNSPGSYISDRFGDALSKLGVEMKATVVRELEQAGLSSRAIAPVVGLTDRRVRQMTSPGGKDFPPEPIEQPLAEGVGQSPEFAPASVEDAEPRPAVTGIDGKTYHRPEPRTPQRRAITDQAASAGYDLRRQAERIERIFADDRMPANKQQVSDRMRGDLLFTARVVAAALAVLETTTEKDTQ